MDMHNGGLLTPETTTDQEGPRIRVLQCFTCKSMEELPDYKGPAEHDVILAHALVPHDPPGQESHLGALHDVNEATWRNPAKRRKIVEQMWKHQKGFSPSYYNFKDTLKEDALKCFSAHHRTVPCIDYRDDSKRIGAPTTTERRWLARELHISKSDLPPGPRRWLCDFCPVNQKVLEKQRETYGKLIGNEPL